MTTRLDAAYQAFDDALRELVAECAVDQQEQEHWVVGHYVTFVGEQTYTAKGIQSVATMLLPFGGRMNYATKGLLTEIPRLIEIDEDEEA